MLNWLRQRRRERLRSQPYPEAWEALLAANVAHYGLLSESQRTRLRNDARIVVMEKYWEGCRGLQVTDEMKVTIAAQACLLLLGLNGHDYFRRVSSILVYPGTFKLHQDSAEEFGFTYPAAGLAVYRGPVLVAWDAVLEGGRDPALGYNVVIHEFAHCLDFLDGSTNGTPKLGSTQQEARWREVMTAEYALLQRRVGKGRRTFFGDYAATNESEFFAVASELFFTCPDQLRQGHVALYELLAEYYGVNPLEWFSQRQDVCRPDTAVTRLPP